MGIPSEYPYALIYATNLVRFHIKIFDQWGEKIFESEDINQSWDGTYGGKIVKEGVYVFSISGVWKNENLFDKQGTVTVVK